MKNRIRIHNTSEEQFNRVVGGSCTERCQTKLRGSQPAESVSSNIAIEMAKELQHDPADMGSASAISNQEVVQDIRPRADMPPESKYERQKVNQNHISPLMRFILLSAEDGIQRGEIAAGFYGLERRYSGYYTDPCLHGKEKVLYDRRYRRAQPAISKALRRLEKRGLVQLVRLCRYVKEVNLTEKGAIMAQKLSQVGSSNQHE